MTEPNIQSELWITLAQAFLPPMSPEVAQAFQGDLADDLEEMTATLDLDRGDINALRISLTRFTGNQELLIHYSSIFLAPPVRARLNLCHYLDGGASGSSFDELEQAYAHHGIAPAGHFRDLPDHISMQLEFLAMLCGSEATLPDAALFAQRFLMPAVTGLAHAIEQESDGDSPYFYLARLAQFVLAPLADSAAPSLPGNVTTLKYRHDSQKGVWRHCKSCEKPFAREKEIAVMTKALSENGLPSDHLEQCPDCRGVGMGWKTKECMPGRC